MGLKSNIEKLPFYNDMVLPWHWAQAVAAGVKYHWPAKKIRVIGVTGTNGKTTTCFMIWKMLNESGRKAGLLTTVGWSEDGETLHKQYEHMTTERVEVLNQRMRAIADAGAEFMVLEVTSHALAQFRTLGVPIEIAVFTNLTHEHLDYHKTFANYRKAKLKLFEQSKYGVVNMDDPNAKYFVNKYSTSDISTYGIEQGDYKATEIELKSTGVEYSLGDMKIKTQIPGRFNVYNSLAAVAVGKRIGLSDEQIERGIYALEAVEGRMNRICEGQDFEVIVDYAHTPDALEKAFESLSFSRLAALKSATAPSQDPKSSSVRCSTSPSNTSKITSLSDGVRDGRIIAVHGGAGRRDESTRSIRGEILGKYSDIVIITEDDSRDEDPAKIAEQFVEGAKKAGKEQGKDLWVELDREKAIRKALGLAKKGDIVLILGKGHEKTILRADGAHEFEDIEVTKRVLGEMKSKKK